MTIFLKSPPKIRYAAPATSTAPLDSPPFPSGDWPLGGSQVIGVGVGFEQPVDLEPVGFGIGENGIGRAGRGG